MTQGRPPGTGTDWKEASEGMRESPGGCLRRVGLCAVGTVLILGVLLAGPAEARSRRRGPARKAPTPTAPARVPATILIDAATGDVLEAHEPDRPGAPASMTKMMLMLLVEEAIRDGQLRLTDPVTASARASKMGGSQVYLKEGETFSVEEVMQALVIASANDAAVALAERLFGTVEDAVARMNARAKELGLTRTQFFGVHGLPPGPGQQGDTTTPADMARLGRVLVGLPDILRWCSIQEAPFRNGTFILHNVNRLIGHFPGADGLKTGHFREAGYNIAATAKRGNLRLIAVVMGAATNKARFDEAARLLGEGFARFVPVLVARAGAPIGPEVRVRKGERKTVRVAASADVTVLVKKEDRDLVKPQFDVPNPLTAPVAKGQQVGTVTVKVRDRALAQAPLVAVEAVPKASLLRRLWPF